MAKTLDLGRHTHVTVLAAPSEVIEPLREARPEVQVEAKPLAGVYHLRPSLFLWCFCELEAELTRALPALRRKLKDGGTLWVSWPRAGTPDGLDADSIRACAWEQGLVEAKCCALDMDWYGVKLVAA